MGVNGSIGSSITHVSSRACLFCHLAGSPASHYAALLT